MQYLHAKMKPVMAILTRQRQQDIDLAVGTIPKLTGGFMYPQTGLVTIAEKMGIEVVIGDLSTIEKGVEGVILYQDPEDKSGAKIIVHSESKPERRLFTLAHEIGHFMLHTGERLRKDKTNYQNDNSLEETEANYFAASLLMPEYAVRDFTQKGLTLDEMASRFGTSRLAVKNRIEWLAKNGRI